MVIMLLGIRQINKIIFFFPFIIVYSFVPGLFCSSSRKSKNDPFRSSRFFVFVLVVLLLSVFCRLFVFRFMRAIVVFFVFFDYDFDLCDLLGKDKGRLLFFYSLDFCVLKKALLCLSLLLSLRFLLFFFFFSSAKRNLGTYYT